MPTFSTHDGATLHYRDEGHGPALLFLHGCWCSSAFFERQAQDLQSDFRVLRLDFRGHGLSSAVQQGLTVGTYAEDVHALIEALRIDPVVVGWSMGALVVWEYHRRFGPQRVRGAVIVEQSASDFKWPDWPLAFADLAELRALMEQTQENQTDLVEHLAEAMFAAPPDPEVKQLVVREMTRLSPAVAASILFDQTLRDYRDDLSSFIPPTLICWGRDEKIMSTALGEHLAEHIPNSRLTIFERSGHCPFLEETDEFNDRLRQFIQSLSNNAAHRSET